jgi:hypothetical protein
MRGPLDVDSADHAAEPGALGRPDLGEDRMARLVSAYVLVSVEPGKYQVAAALRASWSGVSGVRG